MDQRGAWLTDIEFLDMLDFTHNPATAFKGIDTGTFVSNMYKLMNFVKPSAQLERPSIETMRVICSSKEKHGQEQQFS